MNEKTKKKGERCLNCKSKMYCYMCPYNPKKKRKRKK